MRASEESLDREDNGQSVEWMASRRRRIFINHMDSYHGKTLTNFLLGREHETFSQGDLPGIHENPATEDRDLSYEVIGTLADGENSSNYSNVSVVNPNNKEAFLDELLSCSHVIYDISLDDGQISEAEWALQELSAALETRDDDDDDDVQVHYFLLISTIMTWAESKQLDPLNPMAPLNEFDYKKRIAHGDFIKHKNCEIQFTRTKDNLKLMERFKTLVLCCGITYGNEEGPLHFLFKLAWLNSPFLPVLNSGNNKIPLLHVDDLKRVVDSILDKWPEDRCYVVATEFNVLYQKTIVEKISKYLGTGGIKNIGIEESSSVKGNISPRERSIMMLDVNIEPAFTVDLKIQSERSFDRDIDATVNEYRLFRNIWPVRIIILGPPASGKTTLAQSLAQYYSIPYISVKSTNAIEKDVGGKFKEYTKDNDDEKDEEQRVVVETTEDLNYTPQHELERQLNEIRNNLTVNNGRLTDDLLNKLMKRKLRSAECSNQGYVLDGYPRTSAEAVRLFDTSYVTSELILLDEHSRDRMIMPETVIQLEASDEFLYNRVLDLPERVVQGTHYDVESTVERLKKYRYRNTGDDKTLGFFIQNGIHPLIVMIEPDSIGMLLTFQRCLETIGKPRNYGPTDGKNLAAADGVAMRENPVIVNREWEMVDFRRSMTRDEKIMVWLSGLGLNSNQRITEIASQREKAERLEREEEERLRSLSEPLRLYLVKYVFSTLNRALIQIVQSRPEDPIDTLASYLFENNLGGKMDEICATLFQQMDEDTRSEEFNQEK